MQTWYDENLKYEFLNIFNSMKTSSVVDWNSIIEFVKKSDKWPGKQFHFYLSLALIINKLKLNI